MQAWAGLDASIAKRHLHDPDEFLAAVAARKAG